MSSRTPANSNIEAEEEPQFTLTPTALAYLVAACLAVDGLPIRSAALVERDPLLPVSRNW
jgi:hypothetical protein